MGIGSQGCWGVVPLSREPVRLEHRQTSREAFSRLHLPSKGESDTFSQIVLTSIGHVVLSGMEITLDWREIPLSPGEEQVES
jgi:hypothetical protein